MILHKWKKQVSYMVLFVLYQCSFWTLSYHAEFSARFTQNSSGLQSMGFQGRKGRRAETKQSAFLISSETIVPRCIIDTKEY